MSGAHSAEAISVGLTPSVVTTAPGSSLFIDVVISGLADGNAPSVGVADFDIGFDPLVLGFTSVVFGNELGDVDAGEAIATSDAPEGLLDLALVSLLSPGVLDAAQPASFALATLEFLALAPGATDLQLLQHDLGDVVALPLAVDVVMGATVTVVPEPGTGLLVCLALGLGATLGRIRSTAWSWSHELRRRCLPRWRSDRG